MAESSLSELQESIEELTAYMERLRKDVIGMGQKLKLPQKRINASIAEHPELQRLTQILHQLEEQVRTVKASN